MALPRDLRDFAIFVDGEGYKGQGMTARLPELSYKTEEWIGAGMSAPVEIDSHLEKLDCEWSARGFDVGSYRQFGERRLGGLGLRFVGAYRDPETNALLHVEAIMRGTHKKIDGASFKRGEPGETKTMSTLTFYRLEINGEEAVEIDTINGTERYFGTDVRSDLREIIG
jgi:uncharacterized protein